MQDLRYSLRLLRKNPGFTLVCLFALAVGIGANTAIFSMVNAILLRQLAFKDPEQLVWIWSTRTDRDKAFFSIPDFVDYQTQNKSLQEMAAFGNWGANLTEGSNPERLTGVRVTGNAFQMLGVEAAAGRCLLPEDGRPGSQRAVVLSYGLWQRQFAGDREIVGKNIALNGDSYMVVGALPASFVFPGAEAEVITPLILETDPRRSDRGTNFLRTFARMKSGCTTGQVQSELDSISRHLQQLYPEENAKKTPPKVLLLREEIVGSYQTSLLMLLGAVALVLLIACSNLANLLLSRASARHKEMAIRGALGASRSRLVKQLLTESSVLALLGGGLGIFLAWQGLRFLMALSPESLPRANEVTIDGWVLAFAILVSSLAGVIFGLIPALQASKVDLNEELKGTGKGAAETGRKDKARSFLVVSEIALSLVLLITATLLMKGFLRLQEVNPGFDGDNLLLVRFSLPPNNYSSREAVSLFFDKTLPRIQGLPGVHSVGAANVLPLSAMNVRSDFTIKGRPPVSPTEKPAAQNRWVSPDYFQTMSIPLLRGRAFTARDNAHAPGVAIVDEELAGRYWPNENPVGIHLIVEDSPNPREVEIIGVVKNVKHASLEEQPAATFYGPIDQVPNETVPFLAANCSLAIRTDANPLTLATAVRREVLKVDPNVPVSNIKTMAQVLSTSTAGRRFNLQLLTIFAGAAVLLAVTGVYAVMSFSVTRRNQEIGIRIALGAQSSDVLKLVVGHSTRLAIIGVIIGIVVAMFSTRLLASLLYGVRPLDPLTFVLTSGMLIIVVVAASYFPARKATRVDPAISLRSE